MQDKTNHNQYVTLRQRRIRTRIQIMNERKNYYYKAYQELEKKIDKLKRKQEEYHRAKQELERIENFWKGELRKEGIEYQIKYVPKRRTRFKVAKRLIKEE